MSLLKVTNISPYVVSTPVGVLNPGAVFPKTGVGAYYTSTAIEKMAADLDYLTAKGVISYQVSDDGTPTPAEQVGEVFNVTLKLTNAQIKALKATPLTLVPAQGAGRVIVPISAVAYLKYGGTNAFTANASEQLVVKRNGGASLLVGGSQAFFQATASTSSTLVPAAAAQASIVDAKTVADNVALIVANVGAAEIAGNAAADNTLTVVVTYRVDVAPGW